MKTLSVVIPTLGRSKELIDTIQSLQSQSVRPLEIVVVDQNRPSYQDVDQALAQIFGVRHIHAETPGLVINYNRCLIEARGEVVLFLDDDVIPEPKLFENHVRHYDAPSLPGELPVGAVAGRLTQAQGQADPSRELRSGRYHRWRGSVTAHFNSLTEQEVDFGQGANLSFLREALLRVNGFDSGFDGNGYFFEPDACLRVKAAGYRIVFDPNASLHHLMAPSGGARVKDKAKLNYHFVKNGIRLYRRHSPILGSPFFTAWMGAYTAMKAAYNRQPSILSQGLRALLEGWSKPVRAPVQVECGDEDGRRD